MNHRFHMVLNIEMKNIIIDFADLLNKNVSEVIILIIDTMEPLLKKHYYTDIECMIGNYKKIEADVDIKIKMDINKYKFIKQVHNNMHTFSMALIIRWMIEEFIKGVEKYGLEDFIRIMNKFDRIYLTKFNKIKNWKKNITGHMSSYITTDESVKLIFNKQYTLLAFEFL